jgi:VanZ family protein
VHLLFNSGHAPLFGFWAGGLAFFLASNVRRPLPDLPFGIVAFFAAALFGMFDEWHQSFVPGRTSSWTDVVTDSVGAGVTILVLRYLALPKATLGGFVLRSILGIAFIFAVGLGATEADYHNLS